MVFDRIGMIGFSLHYTVLCCTPQVFYFRVSHQYLHPERIDSKQTKLFRQTTPGIDIDVITTRKMKLFYSYSSACFTGISFLMFMSVTISLYVPVQGFVTNKSMRSLYRFLPQEVPDPYNVKRHATLQKEELSVVTTKPTVGSVTIIIPSLMLHRKKV